MSIYLLNTTNKHCYEVNMQNSPSTCSIQGNGQAANGRVALISLLAAIPVSGGSLTQAYSRWCSMVVRGTPQILSRVKMQIDPLSWRKYPFSNKNVSGHLLNHLWRTGHLWNDDITGPFPWDELERVGVSDCEERKRCDTDRTRQWVATCQKIRRERVKWLAYGRVAHDVVVPMWPLFFQSHANMEEID